MVPVDTNLTLGTSGLYDADNFDINKHLKGSSSLTTADQVLIRNGDGFSTYYYKDDVLGRNPFIGWVDASSPTTDAADIVIPAGQSFFILRQDSQPSIVWGFSSVITN